MRPHRPGHQGLPEYDQNGNSLGNSDRSISVDAFNRVSRIDSHPAVTQGNDQGTVDSVYGSGGARVVQIAAGSDGNGNARTAYVGLGRPVRAITSARNTEPA